MNAVDILKYGHRHILRHLEGLPDSAWEAGGVCGMWSVRDIMAHLASLEHVLVEILNDIVQNGSDDTPYLNRMLEDYQGFNDKEVARYQGQSPEAVMADYTATYEQTIALAEKIPAEKWRINGILPWYGEAYDLDDYIVYTFYGHKREHAAQIAVFRDTL